VTLRYMLDTDSVSYALRGHGRVGERMLSHTPSALCVSAITVAELRYGADKRASRKLHKLIDRFIADVSPQPIGALEALRYGKVMAELETRGAPIGQFDAMIAAHALVLKVVLVTNNAKHFNRVLGLRCENWA
jgi:tRNA(fMet)-specific endonuclease VapC